MEMKELDYFIAWQKRGVFQKRRERLFIAQSASASF